MSQLEITFSRAMYLDPERLVEPPYRLYRVDGGDVRWYYCPEDGRYYPSVTSVIGATTPTPFPLIEWMKRHGDNADKLRDERADYGTTLHQLIERVLLDGGVTRSDIETAVYGNAPYILDAGEWTRELSKDLLSFIAFAQEVALEPVAVEIMLRGDGYAGAADIVGYVNGVLSIVDVKSGKKGFYESHEIQLHMYRDAWNALYPELPVERVYNWSPKDWRKLPTYTLKDQTKSKAAEKIPLLLRLFELDGRTPPVMLDFADRFERDGDITTMFQFTEIKDKIEAH